MSLRRMARIILQKPRRMWKNCFKRIYKKGAEKLLFWWAQGNHLSWVRKSSGASADWAQSRKSFARATSVLRQFRTFSAKQRIPSLLFMLKSNKNLEPVSLWVPNLRTRGKGNKVSLSKPFPTDPKGYREKRRRCACKYFMQQNCSFSEKSSHFLLCF